MQLLPPMEFFAEIMKRGSFDSFRAALAQVEMRRGLFPVVEKIVIKTVAVTEICALPGRNHIQCMMNFLVGLLFDINLFRRLRIFRKKPIEPSCKRSSFSICSPEYCASNFAASACSDGNKFRISSSSALAFPSFARMQSSSFVMIRFL